MSLETATRKSYTNYFELHGKRFPKYIKIEQLCQVATLFYYSNLKSEPIKVEK
jgi:hypothetical protein